MNTAGTDGMRRSNLLAIAKSLFEVRDVLTAASLALNDCLFEMDAAQRAIAKGEVDDMLKRAKLRGVKFPIGKSDQSGAR